jgi:hypothetical protein
LFIIILAARIRAGLRVELESIYILRGWRMTINDLIIQHRIAARKRLAAAKISGNEAAIKAERNFLNYDFSQVNTLRDLLKVAQTLKVAVEVDKILPRFGNLLEVLESEAIKEKQSVEADKNPSQEDLRRWALKDAVLAYYQGLNLQEDLIVVENAGDERLIPSLAPDFDKIAKIWHDKMSDLVGRKDKYNLPQEEVDEFQLDLEDKMRGSASEKMIDRYRQEFMEKLNQRG